MKVFTNFSTLYALTRSNTSLLDEMTRFYSFGWPMMPGSPFVLGSFWWSTETWGEKVQVSCPVVLPAFVFSIFL